MFSLSRSILRILEGALCRFPTVRASRWKDSQGLTMLTSLSDSGRFSHYFQQNLDIAILAGLAAL